MDDEVQKPEPKISLVVGILGLMVCIIMDSLSFIPLVGDLEEVPAVIILILSAVFGLGGPIIGVQVVTDVLKAIPVVQELPLWTPAWLLIWWLENSSSKIAQVGQQAIAAAAIAEGDVEELGEAGAEAGEAAEGAAVEASGAESGTAAAGEVSGAEGEVAEKTGDAGEEGVEEEVNKGERDKREDGNIEIGDEVEPEEQAEEADFDLPDDIETQDGEGGGEEDTNTPTPKADVEKLDQVGTTTAEAAAEVVKEAGEAGAEAAEGLSEAL